MARPPPKRLFVFYNPPMVNRDLGIRRSYLNETARVSKELLARKLQTMVFANSRLHTEVLLTYLQQANPPQPGAARAGSRLSRAAICLANAAKSSVACAKDEFAAWCPRARWNWELTLARWTPCVMAGYAGTIAATWQRAGRAGRRSGSFMRCVGGFLRAARPIYRPESRIFFRQLA